MTTTEERLESRGAGERSRIRRHGAWTCLLAWAWSGLAQAANADEPVFGGLNLVAEDLVVTNNPASLAEGDVDGDGDLDLVVARRLLHEVSWFENTAGDGSAWAEHHVATLSSASYLALADLDGDGTLDMVVSSLTCVETTAFHNVDGDGMTWFGTTIPLGSMDCVKSLALGDIDGDGLPDLVWTDDALRWMENPGTIGGAWVEHCVHSPVDCDLLTGLSPALGRSVATADMNGDGALDIIWTYEGHDAPETFVTTVILENGGDGSSWGWSIAHSMTFVGQQNWRTDHVGDLDGDGDPDILQVGMTSGFGDFHLRWLENDAGAFHGPHGIDAGPDPLIDTDLGDVDGDGDLDILACFQTGLVGLGWYENVDGTGTSWTSWTVNGFPAGLAEAADIDGDGDSDSVTLYSGDSLYWQETQMAPPELASVGPPLAGSHGAPLLVGAGCFAEGTELTLSLSNALESAPLVLVVGSAELNAPLKGGTLVPDPEVILFGLATDGQGEWTLQTTWPVGIPAGLDLYIQAWITDAAGPKGFSASNGVTGTTT